jgi:hypothetical protein
MIGDDQVQAEAEEWFKREDDLTLLGLQHVEASQRLHALHEHSDAELSRLERLLKSRRGECNGEERGEIARVGDP